METRCTLFSVVFFYALHGRFKCFSLVVVAHAVVCCVFSSVFFSFLPKIALQETSAGTKQKKLFIWILYDAKSALEEEHTLRHQPIIGCIQYKDTNRHTLTESKHWGMRWIDVWYFFFASLGFLCANVCICGDVPFVPTVFGWINRHFARWVRFAFFCCANCFVFLSSVFGVVGYPRFTIYNLLQNTFRSIIIRSVQSLFTLFQG